MNAVKGFHHIAIKATDFDKSVDFYKALGLVPKISWGEGDSRAVMMDMGDGALIEIFAAGTKREATADTINEHWLHLALKTDDVQGIYKTAISAGATPRTEPITVAPENASPAIRMEVAFVYGPDGEIIEFFNELK